MKILSVALLGFLLAMPLMAEEKNENKKVIDTKFVLISSSLVVSTVFDAESTFSALKKPGVYEGNPILRPFINAGRPATYAFLGGLDIVGIYLSYRLKNQGEKLWWIPVGMTVSHVFIGSLNFRFIF